MKKLLALLALSMTFASTSYATYGVKYEVSLTNGGSMPISPGVLYAAFGQNPSSYPGVQASEGFIQLCQTGNPDGKYAELSEDRHVKALVKTSGPILPGETLTTEIEVPRSRLLSLHFEAMYGKSVDVCSVVSIGTDDLIRVNSIPHFSATGLDQVVQTGAFENSALPYGLAETDSVCAEAANAVSCLRSVTARRAEQKAIGYFLGYSPTLVSFLESKYGAEDVHTLTIPTSGALRYSIKRK